MPDSELLPTVVYLSCQMMTIYLKRFQGRADWTTYLLQCKNQLKTREAHGNYGQPAINFKRHLVVKCRNSLNLTFHFVHGFCFAHHAHLKLSQKNVYIALSRTSSSFSDEFSTLPFVKERNDSIDVSHDAKFVI
jgi:hypothetical protein